MQKILELTDVVSRMKSLYLPDQQALAAADQVEIDWHGRREAKLLRMDPALEVCWL